MVVLCFNAHMVRTPFIMPLEGASFEEAVAALSRDAGFVAITARRTGKTSTKNLMQTSTGGLFSVVASEPSASFSMSGAFVTVDGHTAIDTPGEALERFLNQVSSRTADPYLPFSSGAIGYVGFEGSCALAGLPPAKGFSRFPQARFGIYDTVLVFDHAENTTFVVASGEDGSATARNANALVERILAAPAWQKTPAQKKTGEDIRWHAEPDDKQFAGTLKEASLWLKAEITKNIHIARCFTKPSTTENALHDFLAAENVSSVRAIFSHEDAFAFALSDQARSERITMHEMLDLFSDPISGGEPSGSAASFIRTGENFHRGLYGGMFGLLDPAGAKFYSAAATKFFADGMVKVLSGVDVTHDTDISAVPQQISCKAGI